MDTKFKQKVLRNTLASLVAKVFMMAVGLVLTPYILTRVGQEQYGIWVLILTLVQYIGLSDLGFGTSFVKHIAEKHAQDDSEGLSGIFSCGLVIYLIIGAVVGPISWMAIDWIVGFFTVPPDLGDTTRFMLQLGILGWVLSNLMRVFQSVIDGLQRMDISNGISVFCFTVYASGCIVFLELGFGIRGLAIILLLAMILQSILMAGFAFWLYPSLKIRLKEFKEIFAQLLRFGLNLQVSQIAGIINFHFDKLLINKVLGPTPVTFYDLGARLTTVARTFPILLLSALTPASSELQVREGKTKLYEMFCRVAKYISLVSFFIFGGILVVAQPLMELWVGAGYESSVMIVNILCLGYLLNCLAGPVSPLVVGMGYPKYQRNAELLSLSLNIPLSILLINYFGFYGAAFGTTLSMVVAAIYFLWSFHQFMEQPIKPFIWKTYLRPALCAVVSGLVSYFLVLYFGPDMGEGRLGGFFSTLLIGGLFTAFYIILLLRYKVFDDHDKELIRMFFDMVQKLPSSIFRKNPSQDGVG